MNTKDDSTSVENVTPPSNLDPKPGYDDVDGLGIKAGENMDVETKPPSEDRESGEETPKTKPEPPKEATEVVSEPEEKKVDRSGKVIRELGEGRKTLAESLVNLAKKGGKDAQAELQRIVEEKPDLKALIQSKFGNIDDALAAEPKEALDEDKIRKQEGIRVRAEMIDEQIKASKATELEHFAHNHGLNADEVEELFDQATALEGQKIKGKTLDWTAALDKSLLLVNSDKAKTNTRSSATSVGQESVTNRPTPDKTPVTPELTQFQKLVYGSARTASDIAEGLDRVEERTDESGTFHLSDE